MPYRPRCRRFLYVAAHVVLLGFMFQVLAFDHWFGETADLSTSANAIHSAHCHGLTSGCADSVSISPSLDAQASKLIPPAPRLEAIEVASAMPASAYIATPDHPPRAA